MLSSALVILSWKWQEGSRQWGSINPRRGDRASVRVINAEVVDEA